MKTCIPFFLAALLSLAIGNAARADTITWTNTAGGSWSDTTSWSPNQVPGSSDDAVITNAGNYTVTLDVSPTVAGLVLGGNSGTQIFSFNGQTFTLNGQATINSNGSFTLDSGALAGNGILNGTLTWVSGTMSSILTVATNGVLVLAGINGTDYSLIGVLTNAGTVRVTGGSLQLNQYYGGGELINLPGGLVDIQDDVAIDSANGGTFYNFGTVRKSGGSGTTTINPVFNNYGILDVQTGTVSLIGNYTLAGGTLNFGINSLTNYGQIMLSGNPATLAGAISVNLNNGYVPIGGNSFTNIFYNSFTGIFTNAILPFADAWSTNYNSTAFVLNVLNAGPVMGVLATNQFVVNELTALNVTNTATDADAPSQILTYSIASGLKNGMTVNPVTGIFTWTPQQTNSPSTNVITIAVTDNGTPPLSATNSFTVIVKEVNIAPVLPVISTNIAVNELSLLSVADTATNANIHSTNIGYTLVSPQTGMSISASGVFTWTPGQNQSPSTNTVTTIVTNSNPYDLVNPNLLSTNSFMVVVKEVNVAPSLPVISTNIAVNELSLLSVVDTATNANIHSTITGYTLVSPLSGMNISASGVFTWTPGQSQSPSTNTVTAIVTNSNPYDLMNPQLLSTNSFTVIVKEANLTSPTLSIALSKVFAPTTNASGNFLLSSSPSVTASPFSVVAADVNGDSNVDLIIGNPNNNTLEILTNNGSGVFGSNATYQVGGEPYSITAADVNGDGKVDLISGDYNGNGTGDGKLTVLTNNGSGGFVFSTALTSFAGSSYPRSVIAADVNGDGVIDLISAYYYWYGDYISVFINNGNGGFARTDYETYSSHNGLICVTAADVNGDKKVDLICSDIFANTITVLTNNGNGGFVLSGQYGVGSGPESVAAADVNGDGKMDLITANYNDNTLTVLTNNGSGHFGFNATYNVGSSPSMVLAADVNGDGKVDLVCANSGANTLTVLTNNGVGGFVLDATLVVGSNPSTIAATDVNGDNLVDLICANSGGGSGNTLTVLTNIPVMSTGLGTGAVLSWSTNVTGFVLETNSSLGTTNWVSLPTTPTITNGQNQIIVSPLTGHLFFRLKQ